MLESIQIQNFRCLRNVQAPLRPLTVLVGANDSGKSSFLKAIRVITGLDNYGKQDNWRLGDLPIQISGSTHAGPVSRGTIIGEQNHGRNVIMPASFFTLPSTGVDTECGGIPDNEQAPTLSKSGENLAALLDYIYRLDLSRFEMINQTARSLIPGLERIVVAQPSASSRRVDLRIENGLKIVAEQASTGLRLLLFFLGLAYHPSPPRLIMIEEPENGVHPRRLADVMRLLREITQGKHGNHAAQIVLTTHSPFLLDHVDLETDQVLVFRREPDGSRTAEAANAERLKKFLDEFMLGEVWFNEGEAGLVRSDT